MSESFIHLADVRKTFKTRKEEFLAVSEVTFDVNAGELVSIVGPSGCGKTTILKVLAGIHSYEGGTVRIGSEANPFDPSKDIGMVFQQPLLLKWRKILQNVLLPAEILGLPHKESLERAHYLLGMVGLQGFEDKYPHELSGGMQREKMNLELLRIWKESRKTILFVTHGIQEAVFLGSRVIVLTCGPARMADNLTIDLPYPRTLDMKTHEEFGKYTRHLYKHLGMDAEGTDIVEACSID
jgi:NitT/TauT family transport system ATP-binding protein